MNAHNLVKLLILPRDNTFFVDLEPWLVCHLLEWLTIRKLYSTFDFVAILNKDFLIISSNFEMNRHSQSSITRIRPQIKFGYSNDHFGALFKHCMIDTKVDSYKTKNKGTKTKFKYAYNYKFDINNTSTITHQCLM